MATLDTLTRAPVHLINWCLLGLILIATPYVSTGKLFGVLIIDATTAQTLAIAGFALAFGFNLVGATVLFRKKAKLRRLCWKWCGIDAVFLIVFVLVLEGVVQFQWLKDWLVRIQQQFGL
jgi:surface polysaccharide O-acyltransferase-like enzyme